MHQFNTSFVFHFYILGSTSWIRTSLSTQGLKFESPSKWNSYESFNLEHWSKSIRLHVAIFWIFLIDLGYICSHSGRFSPYINLGNICQIINHFLDPIFIKYHIYIYISSLISNKLSWKNSNSYFSNPSHVLINTKTPGRCWSCQFPPCLHTLLICETWSTPTEGLRDYITLTNECVLVDCTN